MRRSRYSFYCSLFITTPEAGLVTQTPKVKFNIKSSFTQHQPNTLIIFQVATNNCSLNLMTVITSGHMIPVRWLPPSRKQFYRKGWTLQINWFVILEHIAQSHFSHKHVWESIPVIDTRNNTFICLHLFSRTINGWRRKYICFLLFLWKRVAGFNVNSLLRIQMLHYQWH